ncbi:disulfide bond formation protein B [Ideonella sp. B7]|uniref:disulfide bond formation protein B n=1 Tax=Ideonella benzenivorans TaxID=2831643 RepID=UPI001CED13D9|nr:disulfide bond formation protein B [Ideonella benzenivorans]MCA6216192.1 disulfide bond formation protein B [Ideonella benzenivorans]
MSLLTRVTGSPRLLLAGVALASLVSVAGALIGQYRFDMLPCPWCTFQRLIYLLLAGVAVLGALWPAARRGLAGLGLLLCLGGVGVALWQHFVAAASASCALTLADRIMQALGLYDLAPDLFAPQASCADAAVNLLGVPFALWSMALFALCGVACALAARRGR